MCLLPCLYCDCVCLRGCTQVCECVCLYVGCVLFVYVSGHVCMVNVGARVTVCMFVNVCVCVVFVLRVFVYLEMFVW